MRVAVIDIGTNSTRLLIGEHEGPRLREIERRSRVTGLGRGVDTSGQLGAEGIERVCAAIGEYLELAASHRPERVVAVATAAVREASNGHAFLAELRERFALEAQAIDGEREAELTWRGATAGREHARTTLVVDIGGGSTELILGDADGPAFHASLELGVVRHSERHLRSDPPSPAEIEQLAGAIQGELDGLRAGRSLPAAAQGIAVAGTPNTLATILLGLDRYDAGAVEGQLLSLPEIQRECSRLAALPLAERRQVRGLAPERATVIVTGTVILIGVMRAFGLGAIAASNHDLLWGAALASG